MNDRPSRIAVSPGMPTMRQDDVLLTIVIKALNEEALIATCLQSALAECAGIPSELILADSISTDRTVEIAQQFNVEIVQFQFAADRGCGAALQLGYQYARGKYVYVLDGDMALQPGFLGLAMDYLETHADIAGVGGLLRDTQVNTAADRARVAHYAAVRREQVVESLGGGGLYRRSAIESVGYLAHRWLPACEEAELGVRLRAAGWRLVRLPVPAVNHSGHQESTGQMLLRLWRGGRMQAYGMFVRSAIGKPWFVSTVRTCWFVFVAPLIHLAAVLLALSGVQGGMRWWPACAMVELVLWTGMALLLARRKRSARGAMLSILVWHLYSVAALRGFARAVGNPHAAIPSRIIKAR